jgi:anti-sigma B factor antagonist
LSAPFKVQAEKEGDLHTVEVVGELDQATAPQLRSVLAEAAGDGGSVLVDLSDCEFIDSTGLSLMVESKRTIDNGERRFAVCCPHQDVRRMLELTGIDKAVGLFDTRDEALAALGAGSVS